MYDHQYILESIKKTKELEFISFGLENMIIIVYGAKFIELSNFVITLDLDDTRRVKFFEIGLKDNIRKTVRLITFRV